MIQKFKTINCRGRILDLSVPKVMGILNLTPDSFSDGGKYNDLSAALRHVESMQEAGADMIDIGGYSSRPGAADISAEEELGRINAVTKAILAHFPDILVSIDTFRSEVARPMLDLGVHILNDISGGEQDPKMMRLAATYQTPYIMMHMKGTPQTMQKNAVYNNVVDEVFNFFVKKINQARDEGVVDLILDPGFGFGKTRSHNFQIINHLERFELLGLPVLVGISRKSMLYKLVETTPDDVLELTSALHLKALTAGASLLRVHDVQAAVRICKLFQILKQNETL